MTTHVVRSFEPGLWTVGHYRPDGGFESDSDHGTEREAGDRAAYLNGGGTPCPDPDAHQPQPDIVTRPGGVELRLGRPSLGAYMKLAAALTTGAIDADAYARKCVDAGDHDGAADARAVRDALRKAAQHALAPPPRRAAGAGIAVADAECAERRHDERGDCDGDIVAVKALTFVLGMRPGETFAMCAPHADQAAAAGEIERRAL